MTDLEFIELSLRYLDRAASQPEVDRLGAEMIDQPERRRVYRDLVQQSQLAHEWLATAGPSHAAVPQRRKAIATGLAAAAAMTLLASITISHLPIRPRPVPAPPQAAAPAPESYFGEEAPSWAEIYRSPFDYPEFVWRAEISAGAGDDGALDEFTGSGLLPLVATTPAAEFRRLLAPIALLPGNDAPDH
jgi:hypothetical protein